jgi:hypothetical protein
MKDKLKHIIACVGIAAITLAVCLFFRPMYGWDAGIAAIVVVLAAGAKELIWDKWLGKGTPDYYDFFWGVCGGWAMIFIWKIGEIII